MDSDFQNVVGYIFRSLAYSLPMILIWLVGIVIAVLNWRKTPRVSLLAVIALLLFLVETFGFSIAYSALLYNSRGNYGQFEWLYLILSVVRSLIASVAFGLLLAAIWVGRQKPA